MYSENEVRLQGNLTADPEFRTSQSGKIYCTFSLAFNQSKEISHFFNCVAFDKTAEYIQGRFSKGNSVLIGGQLTTSTWDGEDGKKRSAVKIIVNRIYSLQWKKAENGAPHDVLDNIPTGDDGEIPF